MKSSPMNLALATNIGKLNPLTYTEYIIRLFLGLSPLKSSIACNKSIIVFLPFIMSAVNSGS